MLKEKYVPGVFLIHKVPDEIPHKYFFKSRGEGMLSHRTLEARNHEERRRLRSECRESTTHHTQGRTATVLAVQLFCEPTKTSSPGQHERSQGTQGSPQEQCDGREGTRGPGEQRIYQVELVFCVRGSGGHGPGGVSAGCYVYGPLQPCIYQRRADENKRLFTSSLCNLSLKVGHHGK